nr:DNA cytosine methyltransferase [Alcaligenes faecalis]
MNEPIAIDLFCGAGGLSLGAARAGFRVAASVDFDSKALAAHIENFPNSTHLKWDLSRTSGTEILSAANLKKGEVDVIVGGPPCQGFSSIGKRDPDDIRNQLIGHFFRIISEIEPKSFVMENVPGVLSEKHKDLLNSALSFVEKRYDISPPKKISAIESGAPTTRTRAIIVGFKKSERIDAEKFWTSSIDQTISAPVVRHALDGLPFDIPPKHESINDTLRVVRVKRHGFFFDSVIGRVPNGVGENSALDLYFTKGKVSGCIGTAHSPELISRYGALKWGEQDKKTKSVRLNPNSYCPTLRAGTASDKGSFQAVRPIHYLRPRVITPREAARLQGFPDWYQFDPTKWHSFRQIGNSVSPLVAEMVLSKIAKTLNI